MRFIVIIFLCFSFIQFKADDHKKEHVRVFKDFEDAFLTKFLSDLVAIVPNLPKAIYYGIKYKRESYPKKEDNELNRATKS